MPLMGKIVRMHIHHKKFLVLIGLLGLIALVVVACTDTTPTVAPTTAVDDGAQAGESPAPDATTPAATPEPEVAAKSQTDAGSQAESPANAGSSSSDATPTSEPEPEETPVSDTDSVSFYIRGFNSIARGEYIEAERTFTTVVELEPGFARGWDGRGQALMLQGRLEEAMLDFDHAIKLKPNLATAYANRSLTRLALDDDNGAARDAKRAIELDEESVGAQLVLGRIYARRGDAATALEWFDLAVATRPDDGATWWWRGRFYRDVMGDGEQSLDDFNTAIELAPTQAALYIDRALLYIQANASPDLARSDLEEALSLAQDPKLPTIIERVENLLEILDDRESQAQ